MLRGWSIQRPPVITLVEIALFVDFTKVWSTQRPDQEPLMISCIVDESICPVDAEGFVCYGSQLGTLTRQRPSTSLMAAYGPLDEETCGRGRWLSLCRTSGLVWLLWN